MRIIDHAVPQHTKPLYRIKWNVAAHRGIEEVTCIGRTMSSVILLHIPQKTALLKILSIFDPSHVLHISRYPYRIQVFIPWSTRYRKQVLSTS
jgi:hypothetical protein